MWLVRSAKLLLWITQYLGFDRRGICAILKAMNRATLYNLHREMSAKSLALMTKKSQDYSVDTDVFLNFNRGEVLGFASAESGLMLRVVDKISRISAFLNRGELSVDNESVEDSILDIINYMVLLNGMLVDAKDEREMTEKAKEKTLF